MTATTSSARIEMLEWALRYGRLGWPVFPLGVRSKFPMIPKDQGGRGCLDATTDEAQVREWWGRWPFANIGLATGHAFFAVDIDLKDGGDETWDNLRASHPALPETLEQTTGTGGRHILYRPPDFKVANSQDLIGDGIDVRGTGGYIVACPSIHPDTKRGYQWDGIRDPEEQPMADAPAWLLDKIRQVNNHKPITAEISNKIPVGSRHAFLVSKAGSLRRMGFTPDEIFAALEVVNQNRCSEPKPLKSIRQIADSMENYAPDARSMNLASAKPGRDSETPDLLSQHFSDYGNAQRVIALHGEQMRYSHIAENWLNWEGTHWLIDDGGRARWRSQHTIVEFGKQAMSTRNEDAAKFAAKCLNSQRISNALREAQPHLAIQPKDLDRDPYLLNCRNGAIELKTGRLREHRRQDFITRLAPVEYDPAARSELWQRALDQWTDGNRELQAFLQRAVGYSLTGDTGEEVLFFVHGPAAAGKSSFLEAIKATLGDYAKTADFDTFVQRKDVAIRNDIAELAGRRFVCSIEVDEGKKLAEGLVKMLTGGDTVRARFLYEEGFEFLPQFKLWLAANKAPKVRDDDAAMWRRILRIPFENVIAKDKRDPSVKKRLKDTSDAGPAILAWAVEGCLRWQEERLQVPPLVEQATEAYRLDMDPLRQFFEDCCVFGDGLKVTAARLHQEYETWCRQNGEREVTGKEFSERLRTRNCQPGKVWVLGKQNRGWHGIGVPGTESERDTSTPCDGSFG